MRTSILSLIGVLLLALVFWGCAQTTGARALPGLLPGAVANASEHRYDVTGNSVEAIRVSLRAGATGALATRKRTWNSSVVSP